MIINQDNCDFVADQKLPYQLTGDTMHREINDAGRLFAVRLSYHDGLCDPRDQKHSTAIASLSRCEKCGSIRKFRHSRCIIDLGL